ncbi:MAG: iron-containing alcohol dehydrogenase [candidate division KSB1 bacterium]|nr:iron-containing alcohol dehydrogenase [candidate division KSB1 bacterium]
MNASFSFARTPSIVFGCGSIARLPELAAKFGQRALLVTGRRSWRSSKAGAEAIQSLHRALQVVEVIRVEGEPSVELVDNAVEAVRPRGVEVVVAIGGGSVLDAGKAISAMLREGGPVTAFLEGVGHPERHTGTKLPFIAIPTTAGTGSEATKNAVLTVHGRLPCKKSLRHDNFIPDMAIVDPDLSRTCPPEVTAACGMDAFTQLLESYVSTGASPLTDVLALKGMAHVRDFLHRAVAHGLHDLEARAGMAYAALLSGITLANAGLGVVHGLAGPLGAIAPIPHGVACGTLLAAATKMTVQSLLQAEGEHNQLALQKYATVGKLLTGESGSVEAQCTRLVEALWEWTEALPIPRLGAYGLSEARLRQVADAGDNKNNPAPLTPEQRFSVLMERL